MASLDRFFTQQTLIACHDAGAAQMILDNTSENLLQSSTLALRGPATKIFSGYESIDANGQPSLTDVDNVITGTGWQHTHEFEVLAEADRNRIRNIAVVDRATNFELRFTRGGRTVSPSIILIPEYEMSKLPNGWNNKNIEGFIDNSWQQQIEAIQRKATRGCALDSLFIGQPLVDSKGKPDFEIQYRFLRQWLDSQGSCSINGFRPHPSDRSILPPDLGARVVLSESTATACEDISRANAVIGIDSFLLDLSIEAGKKTFRCFESNNQLRIEECRR